MTITPQAILSAFALPPGSSPRRIAKASLSDAVPTQGDRRLVDTKLARLEWAAVINPDTTGIPAGQADGMMVATINVLVATTRGVMPERLADIIHRSIPQPVILLHAPEEEGAGGQNAALSLVPKRAAEREVSRVVTTGLYDSGPLSDTDTAFLSELALPRLPSANLPALYAALIERVEALAAARIASRPFRLPEANQLPQWRAAVQQARALSDAIATEKAAARRARTLSQTVEHGARVTNLQRTLAEVVQKLQ